MTISDELSYVRHMSPVSHPKSIVAQIFFAFQVTWDARGLRCTCAISRERESEMSGFARDCFGCVALGGGWTFPSPAGKLAYIRVRYLLRTLLVAREKRSEVPNTSRYFSLSAQAVLPGR